MSTRLFFCTLLALVARFAWAQAPAGDSGNPPANDELALTVSPNPAFTEVLVSWNMKKKGPASVSLLDVNERLRLTIYLNEVPASVFTKSVSVEALTPGIYYVIVRAHNQVSGKKLVIQARRP